MLGTLGAMHKKFPMQFICNGEKQALSISLRLCKLNNSVFTMKVFWRCLCFKLLGLPFPSAERKLLYGGILCKKKKKKKKKQKKKGLKHISDSFTVYYKFLMQWRNQYIHQELHFTSGKHSFPSLNNASFPSLSNANNSIFTWNRSHSN